MLGQGNLGLDCHCFAAPAHSLGVRTLMKIIATRENVNWIYLVLGVLFSCIPLSGLYFGKVFGYSKFGSSSFVYLSQDPLQYWFLVGSGLVISFFAIMHSKFYFPKIEAYFQSSSWRKQKQVRSNYLPRMSFVIVLLILGLGVWFLI